ncbi:MAG: RagB/SusD family nutrient uptake outer membrane protein [Balneolaceae bacterium]|nr:RagB/SusD family nutrient uptake outer membrane protein [Balneolaceae bacterium]
MKTTKYSITSILILCGVFLFSSCDVLGEDDFLERYPQDSPSPEVFFIDENSAKQAVIAAYRPWARGSWAMYQRDMQILFDGMSDDAHWRPSRAASIQQADWNINSDHGTMNIYWSQVFQAVNAANFAIDGIPILLDRGLDQQQLDPYIAEARFIRAFSYIFLTTFFGDVPLIDRPLSSFDEFNQPRAAVDQIYEQIIIPDLEYGRDNLPAQQPSAYQGSATRATAAAYLAKAHLYQRNFDLAETAARAAITMAEGDGYELVDDFMSIFDIENEPSPEVLFYIQFLDNHPDQGSNDMVQKLARDIPPAFNHVWGVPGWGYHLPQRDLYDAFEEEDPRREYTIFAPGDDWGVYEGSEPFTYTHRGFDEDGNPTSWERTYTAGDVIEYDYRWGETGMNVRKGIYNIGHLADERWSGKDVALMRMGELYLILAEALAEQGNTEALEWVNAVRSRGTVDMHPKEVGYMGMDLVELVRHERRVELAMEGKRLWDLIRWRKVKDVFGDGTQVKRHYYSDFLEDSHSRFNSPNLDNYPDDLILFPIPLAEIDQNSEISPADQNPGY